MNSNVAVIPCKIKLIIDIFLSYNEIKSIIPHMIDSSNRKTNIVNAEIQTNNNCFCFNLEILIINFIFKL